MVILNIGAKGTGKTTRTVKLILPFLKQDFKKIYIFDVNAEYYNLFSQNKNVFCLQEFGDMINICNSDEKNNLFIFEEASIFFSHSQQKNIVDFLVKQRHKNNDFIFNFHSLRIMPLYILDFSDFLMLGKTKDIFNFVNEKFKGTNIPDAFVKVQKNNSNFHYTIIKI